TERQRRMNVDCPRLAHQRGVQLALLRCAMRTVDRRRSSALPAQALGVLLDHRRRRQAQLVLTASAEAVRRLAIAQEAARARAARAEAREQRLLAAVSELVHGVTRRSTWTATPGAFVQPSESSVSRPSVLKSASARPRLPLFTWPPVRSSSRLISAARFALSMKPAPISAAMRPLSDLPSIGTSR